MARTRSPGQDQIGQALDGTGGPAATRPLHGPCLRRGPAILATAHVPAPPPPVSGRTGVPAGPARKGREPGRRGPWRLDGGRSGSPDPTAPPSFRPGRRETLDGLVATALSPLTAGIRQRRGVPGPVSCRCDRAGRAPAGCRGGSNSGFPVDADTLRRQLGSPARRAREAA